VIYWDTSCVIKLYTAESDSADWQAKALGASEALASSALLEAEMAFALHAKERRGDLVPGGASALRRLFAADVAAGRFRLFPVGSDVLAKAADIAAWCAKRNPTMHLRTLDGIHLATTVRLDCHAIAARDERMRAAVALLGIALL
jgi:predicted nucleic acid-binding protein